MHQNTVIGIDLAKTSFAVIELGRGGDVKRRKTFRRDGLKRFLAKHEPTTVALEACGSSHYWGRWLEALGHKAVLLPPQHVKGYLRGQKNDYNDAQAIAEACYDTIDATRGVKGVIEQQLVL